MAKKFFGMEYAPLNIPLNRRLQTLAVWYTCTEFLFLGIIATILLILFLYTRFYYLTLMYVAFAYGDWGVQNRGGRYLPWVRNLKIWNYFVDYFPIRLHKTADLDPSKNYIFGFHPHGILPAGASGNFTSDATDFSKLFPGIKSRLITLDAHFKMPLHRELILMRGMCSSNKESIEWLLSKEGKGNAIVMVVGGAIEAIDAIPNTMKLTLLNRKGFIKLAIKHGADLVPVMSFGENELYTQEPTKEGSLLSKFQRKFTSMFSFSPPIFHGRGVFQYTMGYLPYRKEVNTVVGRPIEVIQSNIIDEEYLNKLHEEYCTSLRDLFEEFKGKYGADPKMELILK